MHKTRVRVSWVVALLSPLLFLLPAIASAATLNVNSASCDPSGTPAYCTIQQAVDASTGPTDTINVAAGTYDAFQVVNKTNLTIAGAGVANTHIIPTTLITTTGVGHKYNTSMLTSVFVDHSTGIALSDMDIESTSAAPGAGGADAIVFWNASAGSITDAQIKGTYTINGDQTGQGVAVDASSGQTTNLTVTNTQVSGFQKNAYDIQDGNGATPLDTGSVTFDIEGGSITGAGSIGTIAQNGVVAWNRGGGTVGGKVNGTAISNLGYTDPTVAEADGILAYAGGNITPVSNVSFSNVQLYIQSTATQAGSTAVDATTGNTFEGVSPISASGSAIATIENKLSGIMEDATAKPIYILPNTLIATIDADNLGIQAGLNIVGNGQTVLVTPGTYSGDVTPLTGDHVTLAATGTVELDLGSGYGINLDNNATVTNFTFNGFSVKASPSTTTYAFKAYKADGLTLNNDTFDGGSGNTGGGIDINTTNNVTFNNVSSSNFHKNGFAYTSQYAVADTAANGVTFNNITSSNNGWTGVALYTVGDDHSPSSIGGSHSISGVHFTGANVISNDGAGAANGTGVNIEGDSDANVGSGATPGFTVTSDGTTLDLTHVAFTGNTHNDITNYQTAPVNAIGATFDPGAITGDAMTSGQRTTEDGKIYDQLDNSHLGLVTYYTPAQQLYTVTIAKYLDGAMATAANANNTSFPMQSSWNAANLGGAGSGTYTLDPSDNYQAATAPMDAGSTYTTNEVADGSVVGSCTSGAQYSLVGYTTGTSFASAMVATPSATAPNFADLTSNEYVIVWNTTCAAQPTYKVHILKYLDGVEATAASANNYLFPMVSSWNEANIGSGSGSYTLGNNFGGAADAYAADTAAMTGPYDYATNEVTTATDAASKVVPSLAQCVPGDYYLEGYGESATSFADAATDFTADGSFSGASSDEYVVVSNRTCPTTSSLTITKSSIGGNGTFSFTSDIPGHASFQITTSNNTGSVTFDNIAPGTYSVTEVNQPKGWTQTDNSCSDLTLPADGSACVITDTSNKQLGSIRGSVFEDWDGDGSAFETKWEVGLKGWTVYIDKNNNGQYDSGEPTATTGKNGLYIFSNLPAGTYVVREAPQAGWAETYPSNDKWTVSLSAGQNAKKKDFGDFKLGSISGTVFNDLNGNGNQNKNDVGLAGWTIKLMKGNTTVATAVTGTGGSYSFGTLAAGTYKVVETVASGWKKTTPVTISVKITSAKDAKNKNFGDKQTNH